MKLASEPFVKKVLDSQIVINRRPMDLLQVNIGKRCNQACHHCHVESSPIRTENMELKTVDRLIELLSKAPEISKVDITGGAPELNPHFRHFVSAITEMGKTVLDRCNLTVLFEEGQEDTAEFYRDHRVELVCSLPCYSKDNVDKQRGRGVFDKSIAALLKLNDLGYGKDGSGLVLDLVYNPVGAHLPPAQQKLQEDYKLELKKDLGIEFNNLFTITNMPIKRYLTFLKKQNQLEDYMQLLVDNFNPTAAGEVMCRSLVSIGWDGQIYDCDFNQMLEIPLAWKKKTIWEIESLGELNNNEIAFADHCYGCTAGAGSSCGGSLVN